MTGGHEVCGLDELEHRVPREVRIGRARVVLIRLDDEVHALHGTCPHMGGPLGRGRIRAAIGGEPGRIRIDATRAVLTCPWHNWEFAVDSGCALFDPSMRVRKFKVDVVDGRVLVSPR